MLKLLGQSWRSILSIVIAYALTLGMFLYESDWLNALVDWSSGARVWIANLIGQFSDRGETAFKFTVNDFTTFMTMMIVFARVVIVSLAVGIGNLIVKGTFGPR